MADITISSVNYSGYSADFTFYPFTGGTISLGSHNIPYTRTSDNYEGVYEMDITWTDGIPVSCSIQIGASDCVDIETSGATYDYGGIYEYVGEGYMSYNSLTDVWNIVCNDADPKSYALYRYYDTTSLDTMIMGNLFDTQARTEVFSLVVFDNTQIGSPDPCGITTLAGISTTIELVTYVNGVPSVGTFPNGGDSGGTYTLVNNPTCDTGVDVDAAAYLADVVASGGTTNATIESAVNTLFTDLKSNGLYTKMAAMYPFVGGTAASHAINAKLNKSFDITWSGGMTHGISGSTGNGTNAYGDTNFNYSNLVDIQDCAFGSYFVTGNSSTTSAGHGSAQSNGYLRFQLYNNVSAEWGWGQSSQGASNAGVLEVANGGNPEGLMISNRTSTAEFSGYRNGTLQGTLVRTTGLQQNLDYALFSINFNNTYVLPTDDTISFHFFADGLLQSEVSTLSTIINTFQTSLGRNTY